MSTAQIIYTHTDEAPALATYSLLPIVQAFTQAAGIAVETRDISLAGRILASFPEQLTPEQRQPDDLAELGELAKTPDANIIKLPNISASIPQLQGGDQGAAAAGLRRARLSRGAAERRGEGDQGRATPRCSGSAVNPVLREGNSDRRVATSVKQYAKTHPHSMGAWSRDSKSHVAHMSGGDFYGSEQSAVDRAPPASCAIELTDAHGQDDRAQGRRRGRRGRRRSPRR